MKKFFCSFLLIFTFTSLSAYAQMFDVNSRVLTLMYHNLSNYESESGAFTITAAEFEKDIVFLLNEGYTFYTASEVKNLKNSPESYKAAVITFDDGYSSFVDIALPILEKYNAKATVFVIGAKVGTDRYLSSDDLKKLAEIPNIEIGNHSYAVHLSEPKQVQQMYFSNVKNAFADYVKNADYLFSITGKKITSVSYPYGIYSQYLNYLITKDGVTTYSSDTSRVDLNISPYGRINRAYNTAAEEIVKLFNDK